MSCSEMFFGHPSGDELVQDRLACDAALYTAAASMSSA